MKILLVEDHATVAEISCNQLREIYDHEAVHAASGGAAFASLESFRPEMILLDLHLPDMTGYEIARRLRDDPRWDSVVIVALTGFGNEVNPGFSAQAGIDALFRKPMDFGLLATLKRRPNAAAP